MMKVDETELEYNEADAVCLDAYMTSETETKEMWAKRVWDCCRRQSEGEDISSVYVANKGQQWEDRAKELWENKKRRRRYRFCQKHKSLNDMSDEKIMFLNKE